MEEEKNEVRYVPKNTFGGYNVALVVKKAKSSFLAKLESSTNKDFFSIDDFIDLLGMRGFNFPLKIGKSVVSEKNGVVDFKCFRNGKEKKMDFEEVIKFMDGASGFKRE